MAQPAYTPGTYASHPIGNCIGTVTAVLATGITNRSVAGTLDGLFSRTLGNAELQIIPLGNKTTIKATALDEFWREHKITGCDVTPEGDVIWDDRAARKADCEARGLYDRDGGYGDPQPKHL